MGNEETVNVRCMVDDVADAIEFELDGYHLFNATRADLLRRLDRRPDAAAAYRRAIELATNATERTFLQRRHAELGRHGSLGHALEERT